MGDENINVKITADDSGIINSFEQINESAEELDDTMGDLSDSINDAFKPPTSLRATNAELKKSTKELKKNEIQTKKNTRATTQYTRAGSRGVSMLSRFGGVGGKATRALGGLGFALASTPFGPFALAAGAATVAYSFFAEKLGFNNDEIIKKNNELRESIKGLEGELETAFRAGEILEIDLGPLSEAEKRVAKIRIEQETAGDLQVKLGQELAKLQEAENKRNEGIFATETERLENEKLILETRKAAQGLAAQELKTRDRINKINDAIAQSARQAANARAIAEQQAQKLLDSLIRDEEEKRILALKRQAEARDKQAKKLLADERDENQKLNKFLLDSKTILEQDIADIQKQFRDAELKARQALLAQFIIDEEDAAIAAAENQAAERARQIGEIAKDDKEKAELLKDNEVKLQSDLAAIRAKFAQERKDKQIKEDQELFDLKLASFEANVQREQAELETIEEIERQTFAEVERTEEEITAFKQQQADERLKVELNHQIARLKLIRDFNKEITKEETEALDAQIQALEARLQGVGAKIQKSASVDAQKGTGLFGLLGIDSETQSDIQAVQAALETVTSEISKAVAERVALLQKEVDARNERIDEIQKDLANEIELNKLGKASNIANVQEQLDAEKAARDKAEKDRQEAAQAQFALDTALQASNLVTAISGLYSSLSGLPFGIGVALATALSAVLIGTFIASKSQAASAAGFKEGGYTGDGNPNDIAGPAHKGEFYLDAQSTKELGLQGKTLEEGKQVLAEHFSDNMPSVDSGRRRNKAINKQITANRKASRARQEQMINNGIAQALADNKKVLEAIRDKPTVVPLGEGKAMLQTSKKTEFINYNK